MPCARGICWALEFLPVSTGRLCVCILETMPIPKFAPYAADVFVMPQNENDSDDQLFDASQGAAGAFADCAQCQSPIYCYRDDRRAGIGTLRQLRARGGLLFCAQVNRHFRITSTSDGDATSYLVRCHKFDGTAGEYAALMLLQDQNLQQPIAPRVYLHDTSKKLIPASYLVEELLEVSWDVSSEPEQACRERRAVSQRCPIPNSSKTRPNC